MNSSIKNEIRCIIKLLHYDFSLEEFEEKAKWWDISCLSDLSEDFIEYYDSKGLISWLAVSKNSAINFSEGMFEKHRHKILICKLKSYT